MKSLNSFAKTQYFSQEGEDGILEEILKRLKEHIVLDGWCSEFGAWDGIYLSNTCHLIKNLSYKAVLIEGDSLRVKQLNKNFPSDDIIKINRFISFEGKNSLDGVYSETPIPLNFDFLSIDVDGVDYHIFESLKQFKPKIICIEFNPFIPNTVDYVQPKDMKIKHGNSGKAITRLAHQKGYSLIASTPCNLFFIDKTLLNFVLDEEPSLDEINKDGNSFVCIFSGYDGTILSNADDLVLGWHGLSVPISSKLQFLPKHLRKFKSDYGLFRNLFFIFYIAICLPKDLTKHLKKVVNKLKSLFNKNQ